MPGHTVQAVDHCPYLGVSLSGDLYWRPRSSAHTVVLGLERTRLEFSSFILIGKFTMAFLRCQSLPARIQILVHRWNPEQGFWRYFADGINQTLDSSVAQALSEAARFVWFVEESACYFKATLKNQLLDYITTKPARLNGTRYGECVMTRNSDNRAGNFSYDHSRKPGKPNQQPDRG